ncbi:MAG: FAD-dependent oxidoreductase [Pseudomonadota bacterium]
MESLAADLKTMIRTPLHESHVARMRELGVVRDYAAGTTLSRFGEPADTFRYVIEGRVEAVDAITGERYAESTLGPTQFAGEISFLHGGSAMLGSRTVEPSKLLEVPREAMLSLMSQIPEMSDIIVNVFAARHRRLLESNDAGLVLIGAEASKAIREIGAFALRNRIPVRSLSLDSPAASEEMSACSQGLCHSEPCVIFGKQQVIEDPTPAKIAALFGLDMAVGEARQFDVLIVGGGPGGVAAGVYAGAEGLTALVLEDLTVGGQAGTSSRIENYMGFPTGISGADLCWRGEVQAMKFGTRFAMPRRASALLRQADGSFRVQLADGADVCARAVVVATGVQYRKLPLERLSDLEGAGVYYAATDLEARFCRASDAVVIGGGNSAGQAAMFLSRYATHVHVLVRSDSLAASMSDYLLSRLEEDPAITIHFGTQVSALHGEESLEAVTVTRRESGESHQIPACGLFIMVGAAPNTTWLSDSVALDKKGFVLTGTAAGANSSFATSVPGVFAVGDVRSGSVKRVASAVGEGSVVISEVFAYLSD